MVDKPDRYEVKVSEFDGEDQKAISLKERGVEGNILYMVRGFEKEIRQIKRKADPEKTLYLDGACKGPYYDAKRGIYSLDHHEECIRQITHSACMQTLQLARTRAIRSDGFQVIGNDPDLDTLLAAWAALNADQIAYDDNVFERTLPLFLLQGNIDANGFGYEEFTGLSAEQIRQTRGRIKWLMQEEQDLKQRGRWQTVDFPDYTEGTLRKVDQYAFYSDALDVPAEIDVHETIPLENGQEIHYALAPQSGIYEVERTLRTHMDKKDCACVVFTDGKAKMTIKLSGFVNGFDLAPAFHALDEEETSMKEQAGITDEKLLNTHWGGGNTIGGPPRYHTGIKSFVPTKRVLEVLTQQLNGQISHH